MKIKDFPQKLRLPDKTPVCQKRGWTIVENHRPYQIIDPIFELLMQKKISGHIIKFLCLFLCNTEKGLVLRFP